MMNKRCTAVLYNSQLNPSQQGFVADLSLVYRTAGVIGANDSRRT